jgi:hypothetical protein
LIICEGKTDKIYLRAAIKKLHGKFKALAVKQGDKVELQVHLFNYTKTSDRILGLGGGTGSFNDLIQRYKTERTKFKAAGEQHPVIFVVDNDSGADCVFSAIRQHNKKKNVGKDERFYRLGHNLYVVMTPRTAADGDSMIEDLFDQRVLSEKLGKKTFNPHKGFNSSKEYGKYLFAEHVVAKKQDKIDFSGFEPLLDRIVGAIKDYRRKLKAAA